MGQLKYSATFQRRVKTFREKAPHSLFAVSGFQDGLLDFE